uniref:Ig-like domain-containing protein n=2 Tax=Panagrolaimus sp. PS1159 TaxID=55785 RepID=A0AC35GI40_9BILA
MQGISFHVKWVKADGSQIQNDNKKYQISATNGVYTLTVKQIQQKDFGDYACVASNPGGTNKSGFNIALHEVKKLEAPQFTGKFQSVTIYETDSLKLYCKAVNDVTKMTWSRDGTAIQSGGNIKIENTGPGESILYLSDATMADGGWYQCNATNSAGTTSLKGRVVVQSRQKLGSPMRERITLRKVDRREAMRRSPQPQMSQPSKEPPKFSTQLQSLQLMEGQDALLDVQYSPKDDPNLKIAWLLNGKALLASSRVTQQNDFGHAVLEINPVTVFDHGEYTIVAVNTLGEARQTCNIDVIGYRSPSVNAFLQQQDGGRMSPSVYQQEQSQKATSMFGNVPRVTGNAPAIDRPNFHKDLRSQEIFEGQPLYLESKLTPINDQNMNIQFFLNGSPIQSINQLRP